MLSSESKLDPRTREIIAKYQQDIPVKIAGLARELGLDVKSATLRPRISGEIRKVSSDPDRYQIRVNRHESPARQRFTIAHEIAHFLLHRNLIGDGIEDSILYRSKLSDRIEAEANRLAAQLLMPQERIRQAIRERGGGVSNELLASLAETFNVSEAAMSVRLGI